MVMCYTFISRHSKGCWGVKVNHDRSKIFHAAEKLFQQNHFHEYDYDQELLDELVWPIARKNMVAYNFCYL
jgi:hypothetical protein